MGKKSGKELEKLLYKNETVADCAPDQMAAAHEFCEGYKQFLNAAKTEREVVAYSEELLRGAGYKPFVPGQQLNPGDKVYMINRKKCVLAATIGRKSLAEGFHLNIAHVDAPRLDLRPVPLFEKKSLAYLRTHYYGGVRKYQWATIPLSIHGVVYRADGTSAEICIGENPSDPVFCITDLLPHLAAKQNEKKLPEAITGENLNILIGSDPIEDKDVENRVKLNVLGMLNETYGITESDFTRAEIEIVPAFTARDVGLDRSMIGAYGHDDRVDAYPALMAEITTVSPAYTSVCVLTDKEEVGSDGVTGLNSMYTFHFLQQLCAAQGVDYITACKASKCLSADVTAAYDPSYDDAFEPDNGTYAGRGVAIYKYTGSRGKSSTSDASAELVSYLTHLMDSNNVIWQIGEMGKIDLGGGGTVAKYVANQDIDTIDIGVPVLSMHSPFEVVSKADVYMAYLTFKAFCEDEQ
ncbi:aminopeptidase [Gemmiger formicilis]|uniref:aminopeptidase n=1 Tax=Gemmiger formicilis TaxID=745368 RepID=UPI0019576F31|nr:aminopeptidase [Gemmiger formicilis]MBM6716249.1 aminopeptidase [Gemmiger formicilis]